MKKINTAFIGLGRAGGALAAHFAKRGVSVAGFYDINPRAKAPRGLKRFKNLQELAAAADIIFITVPDGQIAAVAKQLKAENKILCHASGALPASILGVKNAASVHPLCAVPAASAPLDGVTFVLEGPAAPALAKIFKKTGNPVIKLAAKDKILYHAACVMAGNLNFALLAAAAEIFEKVNIPPKIWRKYFEASCDNFFLHGAKALTGPAARGDARTIAMHLKALRGSHKNIYKTLTKALPGIKK